MKNIDYKLFVPRGCSNYVRFDDEKKFEIDEMIKINIDFSIDQIMYWLYIKIPYNYYKIHKSFFKTYINRMCLLLGNNPYEIYGNVEIINETYNKEDRTQQFYISFTLKDISKKNFNVKHIKNRAEILDLR